MIAVGNSICVSGQFSFLHNQPQANLALVANAVTGVSGRPRSLVGIHLAEARPNPASGITRMRWTLARTANVSLTLYDVSGREVERLLVDSPQGPGEHEVRFDASALPNGLYLCRLRAGAESVTRKLVTAH